MKEPFERAVAGWMQCSDILEMTTKSLEFALSELRIVKLSHDPEKARAFVKAESILRTAKLYCASQNKANQSA